MSCRIYKSEIKEIRLAPDFSIFPTETVILEPISGPAGFDNPPRYLVKQFEIPHQYPGATLFFNNSEEIIEIEFTHYGWKGETHLTHWHFPKKVQCKQCHKQGKDFYYSGDFHKLNPDWMPWGRGYSCDECSIPDT